MLKKIFSLLIILSSPAMAADEQLACDIRLDFATHTVGIDAAVYTKIMDRVVKTPSITEKHVENLGHSGERTLCLTVKPEELDATYDSLRSLIPDESKDFITSIAAANGRHFTTRPPAKFQRNGYFR